jgi:hypothetical protein
MKVNVEFYSCKFKTKPVKFSEEFNFSKNMTDEKIKDFIFFRRIKPSYPCDVREDWFFDIYHN